MTTVIARRHPPWLKVRAPGGPEFAETMATVHAHPTMAEALREATLVACGEGINI